MSTYKETTTEVINFSLVTNRDDDRVVLEILVCRHPKQILLNGAQPNSYDLPLDFRLALNTWLESGSV